MHESCTVARSVLRTSTASYQARTEVSCTNWLRGVRRESPCNSALTDMGCLLVDFSRLYTPAEISRISFCHRREKTYWGSFLLRESLLSHLTGAMFTKLSSGKEHRKAHNIKEVLAIVKGSSLMLRTLYCSMSYSLESLLSKLLIVWASKPAMSSALAFCSIVLLALLETSTTRLTASSTDSTSTSL